MWGGTSKKVEWQCRKCNRKNLWSLPTGYLPIHRPPKKRSWCNGSGQSVKLHKKVGG